MGKHNVHLPKGIKLPRGIEVHYNTIRIYFQYQGHNCREPLKGLPITKTNIKYAANRRANILYLIANNQFDYRKEFPDSSRAKKFPAHIAQTVGEALNRWLEIKEEKCAPSTSRGYRKDIQRYLKPRWGSIILSISKKWNWNIGLKKNQVIWQVKQLITY